jgi:phosphatidylglycerophosphate synthase
MELAAPMQPVEPSDPVEAVEPSDPGESGEPRPAREPVEVRVARRVRLAREDVAALLLVGLVRSDVHVSKSYLRTLFWARPMTPRACVVAENRMARYDEDKVLLRSAVKGNDGFFTTHFVSPYSKYVARWAARRGWTPNGVTTLSMAIGVLAALAFATGTRGGLVAGAVLLQVAFTADCVDGQLARYTRTFSKLGAWLDSIFDRGKEYVVYAGLAVGASGFGQEVWGLAALALLLQTVRHTLDFSYAAGQHSLIASAPRIPLEQSGEGRRVARLAAVAAVVNPAEEVAHFGDVEPAPPPAGPDADPLAGPDPAAPHHPGVPAHRRLARRGVRLSRRLERRPTTTWAKKIFVLPIGERFALISVTAALFTPRITFLALLVWGSAAGVYSLVGRILRSVAR